MKPILKLIILLFLSIASVAMGVDEPVNTMCPVTPDELIEPWITTKYQGETIGFCCKSCLRKFNTNPEAYLENLKTNSILHLRETVIKKGENQSSLVLDEELHNDNNHEHASEAVPTNRNESDEHDHSTDHGSGNSDSSIWLITLGKLHILAVHLPIALLPFAGILEGVGFFRKSSVLLFTARTNFVVGSFMSIATALLGWIAADHSNYSGELSELLFLHRWAGVTIASLAALGFLLLLLALQGNSFGLKLYRITLFLLFILVPVTAHLGGSLIYGANYLF
jgi:uncharacterized membrane protein